MFCKNCGSQMPENASFCTNCGALVQNVQGTVGQATGSQNLGAPNMTNPGFNGQNSTAQNMGNQNPGGQNFGYNNNVNSGMASPNYSNQNFGGQNFGGQNLGAPYTVVPGTNVAGMPRRKSNTGLIVGVAVASVLALVLIVVIGVTLLSGGTNSSPTNVVKTFFKSIEQKDVTAFKDTLGTDLLSQIKDETTSSIKTELGSMNDSLVQEYGNSWYSKIKYKETNSRTEGGKVYVDVDVTVNNDTSNAGTITVVKEGSKYYIADLSSLN
ncbi:MAG: zinc ribbon domain-containing protein [Bacillota bacterium]|nr:zinc ribbon domain-containing protein [Bacillota bacterium]